MRSFVPARHLLDALRALVECRIGLSVEERALDQARTPRNRDPSCRLRRRSAPPPPAIRRGRAPDRRTGARSRARNATSRSAVSAPPCVGQRSAQAAQDRDAAAGARRLRSRRAPGRAASPSSAVGAMRKWGRLDVIGGEGSGRENHIPASRLRNGRNGQSVPNPYPQLSSSVRFKTVGSWRPRAASVVASLIVPYDARCHDDHRRPGDQPGDGD